MTEISFYKKYSRKRYRFELLGQHFLKNKNKLKRISKSLNLKNNDTVIEIGPGHGELTDEVIEQFSNSAIKNYKLILIEKDSGLAKSLQDKYSSEKRIEIINDDALKVIPRLINRLTDQLINYKIVGNIPYYITGYLLRILGELGNKPKLIVLMIQKEVAKRITEKPPKMNLLAASIQFWAKPEILFYVGKKEFKPAPKVDSAVISLKPYPITQLPNYQLLINNYYRFIKIFFKQPRKTIYNNLKSQISNFKNKEEFIKKLKILDINIQNRPQNLNIEQIIALSQAIEI